MERAILIHKNDNVAIALADLKPASSLEIEGIKVQTLDSIPFGHKCAVRDIDEGGEIIKYGEVIGLATRKIRVGQHVHVHNIRSIRGTVGSQSK